MEYSQTYTSQVFTKTQCLDSEESMLVTLRHLLTISGYKPVDKARFVYTRGDRRVMLSLVDDVEKLNITWINDFFGSLTVNDVIITDNLLFRPTPAKVLQLPKSWFGIYSYTPEVEDCEPDRHFSYKTRRLDTLRMQIFLELHRCLGDFDNGYVSFDLANHLPNQSDKAKVHEWQRLWDETIPDNDKRRLKGSFNRLSTQLPYKNHHIEIDEAFYKSILNLVVETYSSDFSIALSEKIFRALVTPRLWAVYSGTYTVAYLKQLGFDVLDDVIGHATYDTLFAGPFKVPNFVILTNPNQSYFDWPAVKDRCYEAAEHNQNLLAEFKKQWPSDFAEWLPSVVDAIR